MMGIQIRRESLPGWLDGGRTAALTSRLIRCRDRRVLSRHWINGTIIGLSRRPLVQHVEGSGGHDYVSN